jgi:hypothetical protein
MADLRAQLRRIETAEPPDLWEGIEARAREERPQMDTNIASVVAFRGRGSELRRRVAAGLVAAAVVALTVVVAWRAFREPTVVPAPPGSDAMPAGWVRCTNTELGFSIGYPGSWHTTDVFDGRQDPSFGCRWFSPQPFGPDGNVVAEGWGYPLEVAVGGSIVVELLELRAPEIERVLTEEELTVDGRRAVRVEYETRLDPVADAGRHYQYLIELDGESTLIVHTTETRGIEGDYGENKERVDEAVDTLRFTEATAGS